MNLVYETADRVAVLDTINQLLSVHEFRHNCQCDSCNKAMEIGQAVRYSPKVAQILSKGEDMTYSEVRYLYERGLTAQEVVEGSGIELADLPGAKPKKVAEKSGIEGLTKELYRQYKKAMKTEPEIAGMYKISTTTLKKWREATFTPDEIKSMKLHPWSRRRKGA